MSEPKNPERTIVMPASAPGDAPKKPYIKPAFRHEQIFETMALACGKINNTQSQCRRNRKNS
ncbi:MAG: hypothetical protein NT123_01875 [Proteobacteria bacterium]|nr:hypothetical protein [Pseudomonadota bacterium]